MTAREIVAVLEGRWHGSYGTARPQLDGNRELVRDQTGKIQYATIMRFRDRPTADAFSGAVVTAIQDFELGIDGGGR